VQRNNPAHLAAGSGAEHWLPLVSDPHSDCAEFSQKDLKLRISANVTADSGRT
jgi:hypothetical protein